MADLNFAALLAKARTKDLRAEGARDTSEINTEVVIVGRTKMHGSVRCIGGITEQGRSVRLLAPGGKNWDAGAPFQVGQRWAMSLTPLATVTAPHTEDVIVTGSARIGVAENVAAYILERVRPVQGRIQSLFDGTLQFTGKYNGYVARRSGVPSFSTGFWVADADLTLREDRRHYDYPLAGIFGFSQLRGLSYVGEREPLQILPAGTLLRVSLARWWAPEDVDIEERCYLQLSGWF